VSYGSGSFSGTEYIDQVSLGNALVIPDQSIGAASTVGVFGYMFHVAQLKLSVV